MSPVADVPAGVRKITFPSRCAATQFGLFAMNPYDSFGTLSSSPHPTPEFISS